VRNLKYRAIEIIKGDNCNCALSKYAGQRMLYSKFIELFESSHLNCNCTFKHYDDRRHNFDRRNFDIDNLTSNIHGRTRYYGRRIVDIHNRARDRLAKIRI